MVAFPTSFEIAHPDDPDGGHLVRIRIDNPEEEREFLAMLQREADALAARA